MEQPPPLSPEEVSRHAESEYAQLGQPQAVKVFGILHVIFASFGIISVVWAIVASFAGNAFFAFGSKSAAAQAQMQAQAEMQEQLLPATVISTILTAVIAALMLYAGILLLKKRRDALKWSNRYVWTSLAGKAANLVMFFIFTVPATKEMMHAAGGTPGGPGMRHLDTIMLVSGVVGILISCIYPVLTWILLNRPKTKAWFANQSL
jgi:hypothetical protein